MPVYADILFGKMKGCAFMGFLNSLITVLSIRSEAGFYKALGMSGDDAMLYAVLSHRRQPEQTNISKEEHERVSAWLEEDKKRLSESRAALTERQKKLLEANPWLKQR